MIAQGSCIAAVLQQHPDLLHAWEKTTAAPTVSVTASSVMVKTGTQGVFNAMLSVSKLSMSPAKSELPGSSVYIASVSFWQHAAAMNSPIQTNALEIHIMRTFTLPLNISI